MSEPLVQIPLWVDLTAVFVGAVLGALIGFGDHESEPMAASGVVVLAISTGLGGGFVRDILLARVPRALTDSWFLSMVLVGVVVAWLLFSHVRAVHGVLGYIDALSLGLYGALGAYAADRAGLSTAGIVMVGAAAGCGGAFLRDLLLNVVPEVMLPGEFFGLAAALTGAVYAAAIAVVNPGQAFVAAMVAGFSLRTMAIWRGWSLPRARPFTGLGSRSDESPRDGEGSTSGG
ncbi:MAG: TRIC cation channel family protein [Acidimicrobiales bacterium]|nr:TRIC cation channel family protein [Acidimicrobiales bacterium]